MTNKCKCGCGKATRPGKKFADACWYPGRQITAEANSKRRRSLCAYHAARPRKEGPLCGCGCGEEAGRNITPSGKFSGWLKYAKGHYRPEFLWTPERREAHRKFLLSHPRNKPIGSRRIQNQVKYGRGTNYWHVKVGGRRRWVLEHRLVMETILGRPLLKREHVHHRDGNGLNNDPNNLVVLSPSQHAALSHSKPHRKQPRCPKCNFRHPPH